MRPGNERKQELFMTERWRAIAAIEDAETDEEFRAKVYEALKLAPTELANIIGYYSGHPSYWTGVLDTPAEAAGAAAPDVVAKPA
jgi:hypothetical protein